MGERVKRGNSETANGRKETALIFLWVFIFCLFPGCAPKEKAEAPVISEKIEASPENLPELAQNTLYLTNQPVEQIKNQEETSFEPVPDENEALSPEAKAALPPAAD